MAQRKEVHADERRFVESFASGTGVSFDEIYRVYGPRVRKTCRRYLKDPRDVEEAVQDTFTKAFVALPRFNGSFRLGAWLARIATNTAIDISRKNTRRLEVLSDPEAPGSATEGSEEAFSLGETPLDDVLHRMRPEHARALYLRAVEGGSHVEIAESLGKTPQQAKALLHRARESFRAIWQEVGGRVAFAAVAGSFAVWRIYRNVIPALTRLQTTAGQAEPMAAPAASLVDAWPLA